MAKKRVARLTAIFLLLAAIASATVVLSGERQEGGTLAPAATSQGGQLLRFHVIANSDSATDQDLKYRVRDRLVAYLDPRLQDARSLAEAEELVKGEQAELAALAREELAAGGAGYSARVELGRFAFPVKSYGDFTLPAGEYQAVRVVLGRGEGQNWWCVLFPPLCFIDVTGEQADPPATEAMGLLKEGQLLPFPDEQEAEEPQPQQIELRFKLLEVWRSSRNYLAGIWP